MIASRHMHDSSVAHRGSIIPLMHWDWGVHRPSEAAAFDSAVGTARCSIFATASSPHAMGQIHDPTDSFSRQRDQRGVGDEAHSNQICAYQDDILAHAGRRSERRISRPILAPPSPSVRWAGVLPCADRMPPR